MLISVIVSTYNQPEWLEKVLWGYAIQQDRDFEVVLADDGSGPATRAVVDRLRPELGVPLKHVWQPDQGFRKCRALNLAIRAARGEYLLFTDGDCIPRADLVAVHRRLATPGRFLSAGYIKLDAEASHRITAADVRSGRATDYRWLRSIGVRRSRKLLRLALSPSMAALLDAITTTRPTFNGNNTSVWRADAEAVNGFEERMVYGFEDREFGERLTLAGIRGRQIRHRAPVVHLDHSRPWRSAENKTVNDPIVAEVRSGGRRRALMGLDQHAGSTADLGT